MGHVISATNYRISWLLTAAIVFAGAMGMLFLNRRETKEITRAEG
jgi:hypothetical protein